MDAVKQWTYLPTYLNGQAVQVNSEIFRLNDDLAREYQAIIAYVNYSQVLKGAAYMNIADELTIHAKQ
jgi:hypothetical protein